MPTKVLILAGTDPLSGAGIFADVMTARARGAFPLAIPTAWVDQDSRGVYGWEPVPLDALERSLKRTLQDGAPDAIKIGMLGTAAVADVVFRQIQCYAATVPVVIDPVLAGGGPTEGDLSASALVETLEAVLRPGMVVTPNAIELGRLLGQAPATTTDDLVAQARALAREGATVWAKGGHTESPDADALIDGDATYVLRARQRWQGDLHGTGCALSTAMACGLGHGQSVLEAARAAKYYLERRATEGVLQIGQGRAQILAGPV